MPNREAGHAPVPGDWPETKDTVTPESVVGCASTALKQLSLNDRTSADSIEVVP